MEKAKNKDQRNLLALEKQLKQLETTLGEAVVVSLVVNKGIVKIKQIVTKSAIEESENGVDELKQYGLMEEFDKRNNQNYFG